MRRAVRYLFVVVAITTMAAAGSGSPATGAVPVPHPLPAVASIFPSDGAVVGVGAPVEVTFAAPVTDRRAAERAIHVGAPANITGHYQWLDGNVVQWIPDQYWPAHTRISVGVQELTEGF